MFFAGAESRKVSRLLSFTRKMGIIQSGFISCSFKDSRHKGWLIAQPGRVPSDWHCRLFAAISSLRLRWHPLNFGKVAGCRVQRLCVRVQTLCRIGCWFGWSYVPRPAPEYPSFLELFLPETALFLFISGC